MIELKLTEEQVKELIQELQNSSNLLLLNEIVMQYEVQLAMSAAKDSF